MKKTVLCLVSMFIWSFNSFAQNHLQPNDYAFFLPPKTGFTYYKASAQDIHNNKNDFSGVSGVLLDTTIYVESESDYCILLSMGNCMPVYIFFMVKPEFVNKESPFLIEFKNQKNELIQIFITSDTPLQSNYIFGNIPILSGRYHIQLDQVSKRKNYINELNWKEYKISKRKAKYLLKYLEEKK